jgi:hypothetical protein
MFPAFDERIDSIVRALSVVVLPSLPPEAGLAREQLQLCVKQLEIIRSQLDEMLSYEAEELVDAVSLMEELAAVASPVRNVLVDVLRHARNAASPDAIRKARRALHAAIGDLLISPPGGLPRGAEQKMSQIVLRAEKQRTLKDRRWFRAFGFDIGREMQEDGQ